MTKEQAAERIEKLRESIDKYRYQYHVLDALEIPESVLDSLKHELYSLEQQFPELITSNSPTQRVAGTALPKFKKITHQRPMLSMEDAFSFEEVESWAARIQKLNEGHLPSWYAMLKIDGLAVSLVYENGVLSTAATRGDGLVGEDVTQNIRTIDAVPLSLRKPPEKEIAAWAKKFGMPERMAFLSASANGRVEIRGEVYVPKKAFEKMNKEREARGEERFANPRNIAAGSIRQLDPSIAASRPLSFFAWRIEDGVDLRTQSAMIDVLQMWGFKTAPGVSAETLKEVAGFFEEMGAERTKLDFWIDGVVIRVDDTRLFADLGVVGKTPRGLVAWKFPPEEATTRVESVEWFVGRTGALTPVATVTPTFVAGTTVTHATLHNADEIGRLDVRVGDTVILTKAGDIIPKILKVLPELRTGKEEKLEMPKKCPVCDSDVTRRSGEVALVCTNSNCYAMERERVLHAARAFAIDGLGEKIVEKLLNAGLVKIAPDIFTLTKDDLLTVEGFAEISAQKLVDEIQARKEIELEDFIVALGIRHVGAETAFVLATSFGNMQFLAQASAEELAQVSEIGPVVAESIASFFADPHSKKLLLEYERGGVVIKKAKAIKRILEGRTFVITGTLASLGREAAKDKVRLLGGSVSESVSKNTTYVVVGENPGSKADKARELGVAILSEADFLTMIQE